MKHGFVKVRACAPELRLAHPAYNAERIIAEIDRACGEGAEIIVFPELSLCGATCGDAFFQKTLIDGCEQALGSVIAATAEKSALVFVGLPVQANGRLYNCAAAIANGSLLGFVRKVRLTAQERRYFSAEGAEEFFAEFGGDSVLVSTVQIYHDDEHPECEVGAEVGFGNEETLAEAGATVIACLAAEAERGAQAQLKTKLSAASYRNACTLIYANAGLYESCTDALYTGGHMIYENGALLAQAKPFSNEEAQAETDTQYLLHERRKRGGSVQCDVLKLPAHFVTEGDVTRKFSTLPFVPEEKGELEHILNIQSHALSKRLSECTAAKRSVIGISGGLDSTLALLVCARAADLMGLPRESVIACTMPGFGTTGKTKNNATLLMQELQVTCREIPIADTVRAHFKDIGHDESVHNAAYENAQARYRTMVLMDIANDEGGLVVGTGDMSELALGWCTYNGDHMCNYAVNCGVTKTLVKALVAYEAERLGGKTGAILKDILATEISPELLPPDSKGNIAQKTEELVGNYELNDFILYHFLCRGATPAKIYALAGAAFAGEYAPDTLKVRLKAFFKRFFTQQFKRSCSPDGVQVGELSLSPRGGLCLSSDLSAALWLEEVEKL